MERLVQVVKEARKSNEFILNKMAEDYIHKASEVLKKFVEDPKNTGYKFLAVDIVDIDYLQGEVTVGNHVWTLFRPNPTEPEDLFIDVDEMSDYVLKSEYCPEEVSPFIDQLKRKGFKHLMYMKDEKVNGYCGLYPFIEV